MNISVWLPPVLAAVIGALLSPSVAKGLLTLSGARARRIKHVPVDGAELYAGVITVMPIAVYIADHRSCLERPGRHQARLPGSPGFRLARKVMSCLSMKKS